MAASITEQIKSGVIDAVIIDFELLKRERLRDLRLAIYGTTTLKSLDIRVEMNLDKLWEDIFYCPLEKLRLVRAMKYTSSFEKLCEFLPEFTFMRRLYLDGNRLCNVEPVVDTLTRMTFLSTLSLSDNPLRGSVGLELLITDLFLNKLYLRNCEIHEISTLATALKFNQTLLRLDLSMNPLSSESLEDLRDMLKINRTLEYLDLRGVHMWHQKLLILIEMVTVNPVITIAFDQGFDDERDQILCWEIKGKMKHRGIS